MATQKKPAAKATKNVKASGSGAKKATAKPVANKGAKKAPAKPVKKAAPAKKAAPSKKAAPAKKAVPVKKVVKKAAPAKKAAPVKKKSAPAKAVKAAKPAKKAAPAPKKAAVKKVASAKKAAPASKAGAKGQAKNQKTVNKKTTKTVAKKSVPAKKAAPAPKKAVPAKKVAAKPAPVAKKAAPAPKKAAPAKKAAPVVKKAAPAPKVAEAPKKAPVKVEAPAKPVKPAKVKKVPAKPQSAALKAAIAAASKPVKAGATVPSPAARPAITRSAIREEKKTNIIVAHRRVDPKLKKSDDQSKTMINYQPDYTRSILDQPAEKQGPVYRYSDEELNEFKELIQNRLEAARKELNYLQGLITRKDEAGTEDTENRYMNMEDGSGAMEREQLAQLASRQIQFINHLEKALMRIENKTYGICRVTGKLIDKARLRAVPHATLSIEAKNTMAKK
jgi:RNA polymerase-binding transcription factor DksA